MSFGLCNAPSTFQRRMISIFSDLLEDCMEVFMDDFTVYIESFNACLDNLSRVSRRCIESNLILNFEKCNFMVIEGIVLGHLVSARGIEVDKAKVKIISSLFLSAIYQEFQQDCSTLIQATIEGRGVFLQLALRGRFPEAEEKTHVHGHPLRTKLRVSVRADVQCFQLHARNNPRTKSRQATACHCLYISDHGSSLEKELLAIVFALDKFRSYLLGFKIIVFFDHAALKFLLKKPDAKSRLIRWMLLLQEFNVEIRDKKGVENVVADHLTRLEREGDPLPIRDKFLDE
ncbi:Retrovirus-related Pol polyprotein from transposon opus, partial [Mucuna pruriens]